MIRHVIFTTIITIIITILLFLLICDSSLKHRLYIYVHRRKAQTGSHQISAHVYSECSLLLKGRLVTKKQYAAI
jgi:hypothetical protein